MAIATSCLLLACAALLSGCFSRQLTRFDVHPQKPVVLLETLDRTSYVFWSNSEHVFWSCSESGDTLNCTRRCGGDTDLKCPTASIFQGSVGTNVR
jgi:hypothetical protein